jgi:outer membrane usher protein
MTQWLVSSLLALALLGGAPAATCAQEPAGYVQAVLDLTLNTASKGEIRVVLSAGDVWADVAALQRAGMVSLAGERRTVGDRVYVRLSSIDPPMQVAIDEAALTLTLTADASLFGETTVRLDGSRPDGILYRRVPSAFLNYGATWATGGGQALNLESGLSVRGSLVTSSFFLSSSGRPSRGLTAAIIDDTRRLTRYQVGDAIVGTGPLGGSLQLAGVAVSRDFSLDPYFIRYPTTGLAGVVTTPSRVDLYVNNQLVRSVQLPPGAYQLANIALPTGAADTRVVVRDAFGGQQEFGGSYYVTTSILSRGLQQFQYAFGAERLRQFDTLWDYGRPVLTGTHRIGITDALTLGGRIEMESGLLSTGPTLATRLGRFGALELTSGASYAGGRGGAAGGIAYEYAGRPGSVSLAWREASDGYENLTSRRQQVGMRREIMASTTARLTSRLTLSAGWQAQDADVAEASVRRASVSSSISINERMALFVSATRSRLDGLWSNGGFAAMSLNIGPRASASVSAESTAGDTTVGLNVQQAAPVGPGFGYRLQASGPGAGGELVDGELRAQSTWAQVDVRQSVMNGTRDTWAQVNGALVAIGGRVMATRPVQDGFALVRVPDVKGVRAYVSHQEMGRTNRRGDLLLPNLLAYYGNQISIADSDVPADRTLSYKQLLLATPYRGGAIAEFPATREWRVAGSLTLLGNPEGLRGQRALDARVTVETARGAIDSWLGAEGEFYLEGLAPGTYVLHVTSGDIGCDATLVVPVSDAPVIRAGDLPCVRRTVEPVR